MEKNGKTEISAPVCHLSWTNRAKKEPEGEKWEKFQTVHKSNNIYRLFYSLIFWLICFIIDKSNANYEPNIKRILQDLSYIMNCLVPRQELNLGTRIWPYSHNMAI